MQPFFYGISDGSGKAVQVNGESVIRIVVLAGVENSFEKMGPVLAVEATAGVLELAYQIRGCQTWS